MKNVFEVFKVFQEKTSSVLYVTAVLGRLKDEEFVTYTKSDLIRRFGEAIKKNKVTEIYITNYKVRDFYSDEFRTDYLVMDYDTFLSIEKANLQV